MTKLSKLVVPATLTVFAAGLASDAWAKKDNPWHEDAHESFNLSLTSGSTDTGAAPTRQEMIMGAEIETLRPEVEVVSEVTDTGPPSYWVVMGGK